MLLRIPYQHNTDSLTKGLAEAVPSLWVEMCHLFTGEDDDDAVEDLVENCDDISKNEACEEDKTRSYWELLFYVVIAFSNSVYEPDKI